MNFINLKIRQQIKYELESQKNIRMINKMYLNLKMQIIAQRSQNNMRTIHGEACVANKISDRGLILTHLVLTDVSSAMFVSAA